MLGETEEYEPLSRAAYFYAMKKNQEKEDESKTKKNK
jgi:thymidine kinase